MIQTQMFPFLLGRITLLIAAGKQKILPIISSSQRGRDIEKIELVAKSFGVMRNKGKQKVFNPQYSYYYSDMPFFFFSFPKQWPNKNVFLFLRLNGGLKVRPHKKCQTIH